VFVKHHIRSPRLESFISGFPFHGQPPAGFLELVLEQQEAPAHRVRACAMLADLAYRKARDLEDREATAAAEKYNRLLKKENAGENLGTEFNNVPAGKFADDRLAEMSRFWLGRPVPDLAGVDHAGKKIKLSDYKGKAVFVVFPDPSFWKYPKSATNLELALAKRFNDRPFTVLTVVPPPADKDALADFVKKEGIPWPILVTENKEQYDRDVKQWSVAGSTRFFIVDAQGILRARRFNSVTHMGQALEAILSEKK
jgi:peroxiredoxin